MAVEVEAYGATIGYGATPGTYTGTTAITKMIEFEPPEYEVEPIQTSNFTTTGQVHTYQPGWKKPGKAKVTILFDKTLIGTLEGYVGTTKAWRVTYANGSTRDFDGFIVKNGEKAPLDKLVTYTFEIQATGPTVWTAN